ncbi:endonuclease/exonuclease/phosphatase family protein [Piscinibacter sakaiensis]|uniref:endonuclease/exonuclease/phosphatase family protein n=1 Tax=Piscinibacter sakaiensis TaxID=1547922 RepID=UPI0006B4B845
MSLRLLTVNIHKGFSGLNRRFVLHELRDAVRRVGADVVFLQEVQGSHRHHARRWSDYPGTLHAEFMADEIWPQYAYGRNAVYPHGDHGNAVLSKFPIVAQANHDVSVQGPERRGLLHCALALPPLGRTLHVVCVHLGLREGHRRRQIERLLALIASEVPADAPLVVAGDFNDWRERAHAGLQAADLVEVHASAHGRAARSFPAGFPLLPLDRIYVRGVLGHLPLPLPRHPWARLSDHAPLAAEVRL